MHQYEFLRGALKPIILSVLLKKGKMHGYAIRKFILETVATEKLIITDGGLYASLKNLRSQDLLDKTKKKVEGRKLVQYTLSKKGMEEAKKQRDEFKNLVAALSKLSDVL